MAIIRYDLDGQSYFKVYIQIRSRIFPRIRKQKLVMFDQSNQRMISEAQARKEEKRLQKMIQAEINKIEGLGLLWEEIIDRWELYQRRYPSRRYAYSTLINVVQMLRKHTVQWLQRPAGQINRGDVRLLFRQLYENGKSVTFQKDVKSAINVVYTWAIEERLIRETNLSPTQGVDVEGKKDERRPEILTRDQVRNLLRTAKDVNHPWYPIWTMAVLTGCRSGELQALRVEDCSLVSREVALDMDKKPVHQRHYGTINIEKSWGTHEKKVTSTKAKYWRNIPISCELYWYLSDLIKENYGSDEYGRFLLPQSQTWRHGSQAEVLRHFCEKHDLPSIKFHTLRACFATHLLEMGAPSIKVMKVAGWKDLKTMERYTRLAGVDVAGVTEGLDVVPMESTEANVVNLFSYKKMDRKDSNE